jgi:dTDP-4-amino-4,6-dideoxygalactose transaminase
MQPLPRYRIYSRLPDYGAIARDVLTGGWSRGDGVGELERAIEKENDVAHALCIAKARVGIYVTIKALIEPGQKVILSPYTISDVVNMVICAGGIPVFADLAPDTCNPDAADVESLIDSDTGAVMVTHLHGLACDVERIAAACEAKRVPLVEDAAQAFGARVSGRRVGTFGRAGIYSFGMYKNLNAFFGGMVVTPDADLAQRLRAEVEAFPSQEIGYYLSKVATGVASDLATWPPLFKSLTYRVFRYGFLNDVGILNSQVTVDIDPQIKRDLPETYLRRMTDMQARIVASQLDGVDEHIRTRIGFAQRYDEGLRDIPEVRRPPLRTDFSHTYTYYTIQVDDRDGLLRHLMTERRDAAAQHLHNCADLDCFAEFQRDCPNARRTAQSAVLLPTYPRYSEADVDRNIASIRRHFGRA